MSRQFPEKSTLVKLTIDTPCEHQQVQALLGRSAKKCRSKATVGYWFHVSGRLGRCYCEEHNPERETATV